ncbi:hypothetical protein L1887_54084 [Cichorium endivia]|nr:hypothetical protein L1887_54084 [Cichorium endivia]
MRQPRGTPVWIGQAQLAMPCDFGGHEHTKPLLHNRHRTLGSKWLFFRAVFGKRGSPRCTNQQADQELGIRCLGVEEGNSGRRHERTEPCKALAKARSAEDRKPAGRRRASGMDGRGQLSGGSLQPGRAGPHLVSCRRACGLRCHGSGAAFTLDHRTSIPTFDPSDDTIASCPSPHLLSPLVATGSNPH